MKLLRLFSKASSKYIILLTLLGVCSGIFSTFLLMLINKYIQQGINAPFLNGATYFLLLALFLVSNYMLSRNMIFFSQWVIQNLRLKIIKNVIQLPLEKTEHNVSEVYNHLTKDANGVAEGFSFLVQVCYSLITLIGCVIYLFLLSYKVVLISLCVIVFGILLYMVFTRNANLRLKEARVVDKDYMETLTDLLYGIKEIKLDFSKAQFFYYNKILPLTSTLRKKNSEGLSRYTFGSVIGQFIFLLYVPFLLFTGPNILNESQTTLNSSIIVLLYLLRPLEFIVSVIPFLSLAGISLQHLSKLDRKVHFESGDDFLSLKNTSLTKALGTIYFKDISYFYEKEPHVNDSFGIGPISFSVSAGDVIFIYGGNGSGKTTLAKVLMGLYSHANGEIILNGTKLEKDDYPQYQQLFAAVFSDFHLFDQPFPNDNIILEDVLKYLELFEIDHKVALINGRFSTTDLSSGQKKRLALISALLECKPVLVLDEWAADQDPIFRKKFYDEIIPYLKKKKFTIIAITHDDHYFYVADRLIRMEYGKLEVANNTSFLEKCNEK